MDRKTVSRLLDAGLKNYSRVEAPGVAPGMPAGARHDRINWWLWLPAPVAVAALLVLFAVIPRRPVAPPPVQRGIAGTPPAPAFAGTQPSRPPSVAMRARSRRAGRSQAPAPSIHVLSPEELAGMELPADLFLKQPPGPLAAGEIVIPEITIREVTIPDIETRTPERSGSATTETR
jgi:hypothetical protein